MKAPVALLLSSLVLAGCGNPAPVRDQGQGSTTPRYVRPEADGSLLGDAVTPVRIGELGPNFPACAARARPRERAVQGPVPVRAAPFEQAQIIDQLGPDAQVFVCSRSHDQRWFGIVYDEGDPAGARCGVSVPIPARRDYPGPCAAGWVSSAQVRFVSGVARELPAQGEAE